MSYWINNDQVWESIPCNNCGCDPGRLISLYGKPTAGVLPPSYPPNEFITSPGKWRFVECPDCRLRFYSPRLRQDEQWYDALCRGEASIKQAEQLFANGSFAIVKNPVNQIAWLENLYKESLERFTERLGRAPKSIVEYGCGVGRLLKVAKEMYPGISARGCDPVRPMVDICKREFGHDVENCVFQEFPIPEIVDMIIGWNVIEHSFTPCDDIQKAFDSLTPGGVLYLRTFHEEGNGDGLQTGPLAHQYHFFKSVLVDAVERCGFDVEMWSDSRTIHVLGKRPDENSK